MASFSPDEFTTMISSAISLTEVIVFRIYLLLFEGIITEIFFFHNDF